MRETKEAGPDHPILSHHTRGRVRALFEGHLLADTGDAVLLREAGYPDRYYFPREDVEMSTLQRSDTRTWCPYKGEACYFTLYRDRKVVDDVAWSYEAPRDAAEDVRGMLSFDLDSVDIELDEESRADAERHRMDDYILHTDSGSGSSQRSHWAPTVGNPNPLYGEDEDTEDRRA